MGGAREGDTRVQAGQERIWQPERERELER